MSLATSACLVVNSKTVAAYRRFHNCGCICTSVVDKTQDTSMVVVIGMETAAARALLDHTRSVSGPLTRRPVFVCVRSCGISVHSNFNKVCTYSSVESRAEIGLLSLRSAFPSKDGAGSDDPHDSST